MKKGVILSSLIIGFLMLVLVGAQNETWVCEDSDDGQDYENRGNISMNCSGDDCGVNIDHCNDNNTLVEYFCENSGAIGSDEYTCRYGCESGVCLTVSCSSDHLNLCWDEPPCISAGGFWYNFFCHEEEQEIEDEDNETEDDGNESGLNQGLGQTIRGRVKAGVYTSPQGEQIRVSELAQNRTRLIINEVEVESELELELEEETEDNKTKIKIKLSNGRNSEIKIMPATASKTALARLRLKVCSEENNCTIQLKEVGKGEGNKTKLAYELQRQRNFRLYGLFKKTGQVRVQVDAETGEIIKVKKPWWAFLASEPEEEIEEDEDNETNSEE